MRVLISIELKKVNGGKTDWDAYNKNHGIIGPINKGYGDMPNPPNFGDFSQAVGEGALFGAYVGGPIGAAEGAFGGGAVYLIGNAYYNVKNYYF